MAFARSQPSGALRLARTNPLLRGMRHSWGTNVAGPGVAYDAVGRANGAFGVGIPSTTSGNQWAAGARGYYLNYDDAGTGTVSSVSMTVGDSNGSGSPGSSVFSFAARIRLGSLQSGMAIYGSYAGGIEIQISSAGKIELVKQQTAALGASTGSIAAGVDVDIGIAYDGSTVSYYINGVPAGSSSNAQTFNLAAQYFLGAAGNGERLSNGSRIYRTDIWDRALTAGEFRAWSSNPWQIYDAASEDDDALLAAAADTALSGMAAAVAAAAGALTTSIRLAGSGAATATASGALNTGIRMAGAAQAQASAAGTLSTAVQLAGTAQAGAMGAGGLATSIRLTGTASAVAAAVGALAGGGAGLSGTATVAASGSGTLATGIPLTGAAYAQASAAGALTTAIALAGAAAASATAVGMLAETVPAVELIDVSKISPARIVVFDGSGSRVVPFDGSGSRLVVFEGSGKRVRFDEMNISAIAPIKVGDKWMTNRDPDEESHYVADITQELLDRNTTAKPGGIELVLHGVTQLEEPSLQVVTLDGVQRTFVVAFLGGDGGDPPDDWHWSARVRCMNGERFDKTTWFKRVDT